MGPLISIRRVFFAFAVVGTVFLLPDSIEIVVRRVIDASAITLAAREVLNKFTK